MIPDLNMLHSRLKEEYNRLTKELENIEDDNYSLSADNSGSWFGRRDEQANNATESRKQQLSEDRLRRTLAQVEHTLHKFNDGTYGLCDNCGHPIGPARLEAIPYAFLCVNCKTIKEKH